MKSIAWKWQVLAAAILAAPCLSSAQAIDVKQSTIGPGWANNSVNVTVFRKNSLVTHQGVQYAAYYDAERYVVLAKRRSGAGDWTIHRSQYQGKADDAHNGISIMVDGAGYLHVAWDHHDNPLRYARSTTPGGLALGERQAMLDRDEQAVSYPEFYRLPGGDLFFLYRDGASGSGNLVMNRYRHASGKWERLQDKLIDGEGRRNAYWQAHADGRGVLHLSWVWRESPDVASNHDLAYARSRDGGRNWERSDGSRYQLPITAASAEYALRIPQHSDLINQTSMAADGEGHPYIAGYWRDAGSPVPQYRVVFNTGQRWQTRTLPLHKTAFSLSGGGTKRIPMARPQLLLADGGGLLVFRDEERGSKVSVAVIKDFQSFQWSVHDLSDTSVGAWEPTFDSELWRARGILSLLVQNVAQVDGEGVADRPAEPVRVLDWEVAKQFVK
jgi:hypothetical protein